MSVDVERLRAELEFITANPEQWEQREIAVRKDNCGTACCVAGWTVIHAGYQPKIAADLTDGAIQIPASLTKEAVS